MPAAPPSAPRTLRRPSRGAASATATTTAPRQAVIVAGLRTPFVKAGGSFAALSALELAARVAGELVQRTELAARAVPIDRLIFGQVLQRPDVPNIAREVVLAAGLSPSIDAFSVARACATSTQALVEAAQAIMLGEADVVLCGGVESLSKPPLACRDGLVEALMQARSAKRWWHKARPILNIKPRDLLPLAPAIKELSTGLSMGESAEKMAQANGISRAAQDALALASHHKAAAAWASGVYAAEVMPVAVPATRHAPARVIERDSVVRADTSLAKLAGLKPVFGPASCGTITAGNSSPLTDGAAALLVMEEQLAVASGFEPLARVRGWSFGAVDPQWQLLMGPALAIPKLLRRFELTLADIDFIDLHEAFAAQVLSNTQALACPDFAAAHLGLNHACVGPIPPEKLNIYGGSIALGHPFGATGARQALTMANELQRRGRGRALVAQCASGGLGAALLLER